MSFLPIFALEAQEGRLFKPLAYTKTFAMAAAALLSVTLVPALMMLFVRGRIMPEHKNPVNRFLIWIYRPVIRLAAALQGRHHPDRARGAGRQRLAGAAARHRVHADNLNEGTLFYMPTTLPGLSVTKAAELLQTQDKIIKSFPEVASVYGKAGTRGDRHRSGADRDVRDRHQSQARERMAARHDGRQADRRDGQGAAVPRRVQRLDHADQGAHRHALDRHPHAGRRQGLGTDLAEMEKLARQIEAVLRNRAGHHQRLRRARDRRLLPQHRSGPRAARALRPHGRRRART